MEYGEGRADLWNMVKGELIDGIWSRDSGLVEYGQGRAD